MVQCKYLFDFVLSKEPKQKSSVAVRVCIHARELRKVKFIPRTDGAKTRHSFLNFSFFLTTRVPTYDSGISKQCLTFILYFQKPEALIVSSHLRRELPARSPSPPQTLSNQTPLCLEKQMLKTPVSSRLEAQKYEQRAGFSTQTGILVHIL